MLTSAFPWISEWIIYISLGIIGFNSTMFYAAPGQTYLVQYPWGDQYVMMDPGYQFLGFGEAIEFDKEISVAFLSDSETQQRVSAGTTFTGIAPPYLIRFNDSVTAEIQMTARFRLPEDPEAFRRLAIAYRNQQNLVYSTLLPIMKEAMWNTGRMFSAQAYISGSGDFENSISDQIQNGTYRLEIEEKHIFTGETPATHGGGTAQVQRDQTVHYIVRQRMQDGKPIRKDEADHPLKKFGIRLVQANVHLVDPDPNFKASLHEQRQATSQVAIERQQARREEERKTRIIAQGEAEKAEVRIQLEKSQIEQVVAAETRALEAQQAQVKEMTEAETRRRVAEVAFQQAEIELKTSELEAQRVTIAANAEAGRRRSLIEADNGLQLRLNTYESVSKSFAGAISGQRLVPEIAFCSSGSAGNGDGYANATQLIGLITAKLANDLGVNVTGNAPQKPADAAKPSK